MGAGAGWEGGIPSWILFSICGVSSYSPQGRLWAGSQLKCILMILNSLSSLKFHNIIINLIYFPCFLLSRVFKSYHLLPAITGNFLQTPLHVKLSLHFLLLFMSMIFVLGLVTIFMKLKEGLIQSNQKFWNETILPNSIHSIFFSYFT